MRYLRALPFFVVLAVVLFSGLKPEPVPQVFDQQDKLHHLLGFAAFAFTLRLAFPRPHFIWLLLASLGAALVIELGQGLLPHRTPSVGDMLANGLGVLAGWVSSLLVQGWLWRGRSGAERQGGDEVIR
ncbi:hypothetical protein THL1_626 [Pseudomonas sp. TCU-HL1]|nr:hypothetical protein THL1_626 [Pseudomonas sp. TCU-HL1]